MFLQPLEWTHTPIFHIRGGKIVETWVFWDRANLMKQLGQEWRSVRANLARLLRGA